MSNKNEVDLKGLADLADTLMGEVYPPSSVKMVELEHSSFNKLSIDELRAMYKSAEGKTSK